MQCLLMYTFYLHRAQVTCTTSVHCRSVLQASVLTSSICKPTVIVNCVQLKDLEELLHEKTESCEVLETAKNRADDEARLLQITVSGLRDIIHRLETDADARFKVTFQYEQVCLCVLTYVT